MSIVKNRKDKDLKNIEDNALIELVRKKNQLAYKEIVVRYQKKLLTYLYRLVGNKEEAEDILQNVFVKAYKNSNHFDVKRKFSSWIYRIAHNEAINFLKRRNKRKLISLEDIETTKDKMNTVSLDKSPIDAWIGKEFKKEMHEAMDELPAKYKEVLTLRYFLNKSYEEMSEILGKPANTVGTLINRAKKNLLEIIKKKWV
jgi:RNA polymerase sigma-70 factor (ECF subfamily)